MYMTGEISRAYFKFLFFLQEVKDLLQAGRDLLKMASLSCLSQTQRRTTISIVLTERRRGNRSREKSTFCQIIDWAART